jgi:hypothetical protein
MAEPKTRPTKASVTKFIAALTPAPRRLDALAVSKLMKRVTGEKAELWGPNIVGYGRYTMTYANGSEMEWMLTGFSPRKTSLVLYVLSGFPRQAALLAKLGRHKAGKGCLYIARLADVDVKVLEDLLAASFAHKRKKLAAK